VPTPFDPVPSLNAQPQVRAVEAFDVGELDAVAVFVTSDGDVPTDLGLSREVLVASGFSAKAGTSLLVPRPEGPLLVAVGVGATADLDAAGLRDAAAAAGRATAKVAARLGLRVPTTGTAAPEDAGRALAEGIVLARYRYTAFIAKPGDTPLTHAELLVDGAEVGDVAQGVAAGLVSTRTATVARDLANTPAGYLSASTMADVAVRLGGTFGFAVTVHDKAALLELGCGGLLGVNAGSTEPPRMIVLHYRPQTAATGHLGLVGKGIMYDSGGISLKPSDPMHLLMKMDMGGAAAVLGAFTGLRDAGASAEVTAWLMCTDNMPSGSATKLGDILVARNGTTVEVKNTDAEGRLVMMDGLALAVEAGVDAIVDIATLTGAALMALGGYRAPVYGTAPALIEQVVAASTLVDDPVWAMPLEKKYRSQLDSEIADIANLGGSHAGATTAALFLSEFVGETPWAHLDIAGTMQVDKDDSWRSKGATGFGARILMEVARGFTTPA